jgi:hypothetical protein
MDKPAENEIREIVREEIAQWERERRNAENELNKAIVRIATLPLNLPKGNTNGQRAR